MALAVTVRETIGPLPGGKFIKIGTLAFDSSYPTGGEALPTISGVERVLSLNAQGSGYTFELDEANQKVKVYRVPSLDGNAANAQALAQVSDTADLSGITAAPFIAICR